MTQSPRIVAVIPARMGSTRFPGKPLAHIHGRPMIEHVVRRVAMCERLDAVHVATCDAEIRDAVESFGGSVIMTSAAHERASDRVAEAAQAIDADIVVMVQGDEPMVVPAMIAEAIAPMLADETIGCVNLARRITDPAELADRNTIKVVRAANGDALYFSRAPIPAVDATRLGEVAAFKQVCVIPLRAAFLQRLARLAPTPLERAESIDMLRALEHGLPVRMVETAADTHAVDTPEDLRLVSALMRDDPLLREYAGAPTLGRVAAVSA
jgi:3-deoxy-manno-octulosonate cytidylyltransferase (CMP-KDO synthetase)